MRRLRPRVPPVLPGPAARYRPARRLVLPGLPARPGGRCGARRRGRGCGACSLGDAGPTRVALQGCRRVGGAGRDVADPRRRQRQPGVPRTCDARASPPAAVRPRPSRHVPVSAQPTHPPTAPLSRTARRAGRRWRGARGPARPAGSPTAPPAARWRTRAACRRAGGAATAAAGQQGVGCGARRTAQGRQSQGCWLGSAALPTRGAPAAD